MAEPDLGCPFCDRVASGPLLAESSAAVAFDDAFPVSPGHTLVVPREHVESIFVLDADMLADLWYLVGEVRATLAAKLSAGAFNIGVNDGQVAGQTVEHAHVHVIPRFRGDVPDPRGGVRAVVPGQARYSE